MVTVHVRVLDVVLCDTFDAFLLKLSYTLIMTYRKQLMSMNNMEDILEFMTSTLPSIGPNNSIAESGFLLGQSLSDLQDISTAALHNPWTKDQRSILDMNVNIESLYDTISRVEDALTTETVSENGKRDVCFPKMCFYR